uniref:Uncharacterized protein n=1 Tax=Aegilops tauschii TaxID=37682 RepID=N1QSU1_AEGTA
MAALTLAMLLALLRGFPQVLLSAAAFDEQLWYLIGQVGWGVGQAPIESSVLDSLPPHQSSSVHRGRALLLRGLPGDAAPPTSFSRKDALMVTWWP